MKKSVWRKAAEKAGVNFCKDCSLMKCVCKRRQDTKEEIEDHNEYDY